METTENKKNIPLFVLKIVLNVIFYAVIIMLLLFSIMNINAGSSNGGFPNIFGKGILSVQSGSMERLDTISEYDEYEIGGFSEGDLLFVDVIDYTKGDINKLKKGDVITFTTEIGGKVTLNTHRIVYIKYDSEGNVTNFSTEGDRKASLTGIYDPDDETKSSMNQKLVSEGDIDTFASESEFATVKGIVTGVVSGGGTVLDNLQNNWFLYFIVPVLIFLLIEIFLVVKNIIDLKNSKNKLSVEEQKEQLRLELEAEKEKMRQEILAEMQSKEEKLDNSDVIEIDNKENETSNITADSSVDNVSESATVEPVIDEKPIDEAKEEFTPISSESDETNEVEDKNAESNENVEEDNVVLSESNVEDTISEEEIKEDSTNDITPTETVIEDSINTDAVEEKAEEPITETKEEVKEEKKPAPKKTTTKKSSGTAKKTSTTGTTKKSSTTSTAKKTGTTTKKSTSSTTKKSSTTANKTTGTKKSSTSTTKKTTTKKEDTSKSKKEKSE